MMDLLLLFLVILPMVAFGLVLLFANHQEKTIAGIANTAIVADALLFLLLGYQWWKTGFAPLVQKGFTLFATTHYTFAVDFYMDTLSVVFFFATCVITLLVLLFSRFYMHRDPGFKRFYATILIFFAGLTLSIFAGTFETLFLGWEFIGIASFVLIAFYRDRFLPVKNALRVFTLYRIADAFFLVALWYAHHTFHQNIHFAEMTRLVATHGEGFILLGVLFLVVALIKSAQYPFSYWLPRAMEGPTTSSAIFYGSLSVHMGLFVLMRTYPLWEGSVLLRGVIVLMGLLTAIIATNITRVQSSIKAQIAYASITQIGLMFVEVALGLYWLALLHFVSNASLRTYQLLISPSIVGYLIHEQFFYFVCPPQKMDTTFLGKLRASLYVLGIKEWNMDGAFYNHLWRPLKSFGRAVKFFDLTTSLVVLGVFALLMFFGASSFALSHMLETVIVVFGLVISVLLYIRAFSSKKAPEYAWRQIFVGNMFTLAGLAFFADHERMGLMLYLLPVAGAYLLGEWILWKLQQKEQAMTLVDFQGHAYEYPYTSFAFFVVSLAMIAFPLTSSFLGQELLLSYLHLDQWMIMALFALGYVLSGVSALRIFAKVFYGPHKKPYHEIAYKSS